MEEFEVSTHTCAFCDSDKLFEVIDFGIVAIAGGFLKKEDIPNEKKYPLVIVFCETCYTVQVRDHIDPKVLFATDYYFSSAIKTMRDHFHDYADEMVERFLPLPDKAKVLEFGSNDGVLLKPLADLGVGTVIGVDPAENIISSIKDDRLILVNDFFNVPCAAKVVREHGKIDLVMANNTFAHISGINDTTKAVYDVLSDDGVFVFEVHYLGNILEGTQYDWMYHEHIYYYSLLALQNHLARHDMVIFDIKRIPTHGGSIRYFATKKDSVHAKTVAPAVNELHDRELQLGYDKATTYQAFASRAAQKKTELMQLLKELKSEGKSIVGYGASGRANTIIQYCGITHDDIEYVIDDAPAKHGLYTPGSHFEIKSNDALSVSDPDYILLFAWSFYAEITKRCQSYFEGGGMAILPLPEVKVENGAVSE